MIGTVECKLLYLHLLDILFMVEPNFIFMDIKSQHFFRVDGYLLVGFRIRNFTRDRSNNIHSPGPVI